MNCTTLSLRINEKERKQMEEVKIKKEAILEKISALR